MATPEQLADEARRARKVRHIVDISTSLIMQGQMTRGEGEAVVAFARDRILELFPGDDETFEIIYTARFRRLLDEFTRPDAERRGVVLPFKPRPH